MNRATYDALLASKFIPSSVIATRPITPTRQSQPGWNRGKERDLQHNCWLVRTSDPEKKRGDVKMVSFDSFIDFPRRSLADDDFIADRLTKKLLVLSCLTLGPRDHGDLGGAYVAQIATRFDWLVRYRQGQAIAGFSEISEDFAEDLCSVLSSGGALATIPIYGRLEQLASEERAGRWALPLAPTGEIDWLELSATLGTTLGSISRNGEFRLALIEAFPGMNERASAALTSRMEAQPPEIGLDIYRDGVSEADGGHDDASGGVFVQKMKAMALRGYTETLELTYRILSHASAHDRMLEYPFEKISEDALLERYGAGLQRTATILPQDMLRMMTEAAKWVGTYGKYIIAGLNEFKRARRAGTKPRNTKALAGLRPSGAPKLRLAWTHPTKIARSGEMMLDTATKYLLASCAILVGSFAARRHVGVESLHYGCLTEHKNGLLEMAIYIAKTDQDHVNIPVPELLRIVIEVLEQLSSHLRKATGSKWLFEVAFDETNPRRLISISFNTTIKEFLDSCIAPPDGEGRWTVAMHQLRRGYGIWFYYGLEGANSEALSLMYRHRDPRMTRIYFTLVLPGLINQMRSELEVRRRIAAANRTKEQQAWIEREERRLSYLRDHAQSFDDVRCEIFVEKLIAVWRGQEAVIGHGGKALFADLTGMVEKTMARIRIGSRVNNPSSIETPLFDRFLTYVKSNFLEPVIGTNMWCRAEPRNEEHLARARCLKLKKQVAAPWNSEEFLLRDIIPDYDFASNAVCIDCPLCVAFEKGQKALQDELERERANAVKAPTISLREEAELLLDELEEAVLRAGPPLRGEWI
ncbi:hypothetical protein [uncultured Agrobacterium sp.]|uniref:hypothetical protein n=1 Tax=uncultured Agrobacterium sp. TaxID=157277 RepID=UPI0025DC5D8A|nr:hypothetical protein [uncultured Agrobacterium sp.]